MLIYLDWDSGNILREFIYQHIKETDKPFNLLNIINQIDDVIENHRLLGSEQNNECIKTNSKPRI